jgi:hypothetical protein
LKELSINHLQQARDLLIALKSELESEQVKLLPKLLAKELGEESSKDEQYLKKEEDRILEAKVAIVQETLVSIEDALGDLNLSFEPHSTKRLLMIIARDLMAIENNLAKEARIHIVNATKLLK